MPRPALLLLAVACSPWLIACQASPSPPASPSCYDERELRSLAGPRSHDVDVLFVIDRSPGMLAKQRALAQRGLALLRELEGAHGQINYHVGVVSADLGSQGAGEEGWPAHLAACATPQGDDGALQALPCTARPGLSAEARRACAELCPDPRFVPAGGAFLSRINGVSNVPVHRVDGRDTGPERAFQCLTLLGDSGCGVAAPLEASKRALDGQNPLNNGFLRTASTLAVFFLTDDDDCSVAPSRRGDAGPSTMDCPAPDAAAPLSCFDPVYRCLAGSVRCDEPLNTPGVKTNCSARADSYLEKVDSYVRFFETLRPPSRLLISGLWPLPALDRTSARFVVAQDGGGSVALRAADGADAACVAADDPVVTGRSQLRLSRFAAALRADELSVCATGRYEDALRLQLISHSDFLFDCLPFPPARRDGAPLCLVNEVGTDPYWPMPDRPMTSCSADCCGAWAASPSPSLRDPAIVEACQGEVTAPCYCIEESSQRLCAGGALFGVWRRQWLSGYDPTEVSVRCGRRDDACASP